jgi:hypothetical protein
MIFSSKVLGVDTEGSAICCTVHIWSTTSSRRGLGLGRGNVFSIYNLSSELNSKARLYDPILLCEARCSLVSMEL